MTFMLKLVNHLARLGHSGAAQSPVRLSWRTVETGNGAFPGKVQLKPLRAIDNILQHEVINRGVGVLVFRANVKQIATRNPVRTIIEHVQPVTTPHHYQFTEFMGMFSKHALRIAIGDGDSLFITGKKVFF